MSEANHRVLTGSRPSGSPHLGNYFGAYKPAIDLQSSYEAYIFLADLHTLNSDVRPEELRAQSLDMIATMLACGLDPNKGCFYAQSSVPEVCELTWMLGCQSPYGLMLRAHSFKDAQAKGIEVNMGVFNYPVLMAADILLYDATLVPVGKDQKQHLEMARDIGQRFNNRYGETLVIPEPMISEDVGLIPGTDGEKMSKSKNNVIPIFATDKQWKKAVMNIVTDSKELEDKKDPETCNIYQIFKIVEADAQKVSQMAEDYRGGGYGYGHAKLALLESVKARFSQMRDRYFELVKRPDELSDIVAQGSRRARTQAQQKIEQLREAIGLINAGR